MIDNSRGEISVTNLLTDGAVNFSFLTLLEHVMSMWILPLGCQFKFRAVVRLRTQYICT